MDNAELAIAGEIAAITLVVRQLIARLPDDEALEMRAFIEDRISGQAATPDATLLKDAMRSTVKVLFTAATPKSDP